MELGCEPDAGDGPGCIAGAPELCDGRDNDCDGLTDESFDLDFDVVNCGACGNACAGGPHAAGVCVLRECTALCAPGWSDLDGDPRNGCEAGCTPTSPATETSCNGVDNDCDGRTDEDWTSTGECGTGFCERSSICFRGEVRCVPRLPPGDEDSTCDGIDDDCDHATDEDCGADADADADGDADADADADLCGNGIINPPEECDGSPGPCGVCGEAPCRSDCMLDLAACVDPGQVWTCHPCPDRCEDCYVNAGGACSCTARCVAIGSCTQGGYGPGDSYCTGWIAGSCSVECPTDCDCPNWCRWERRHAQDCDCAMECP
jgi:hypothetical protein